MSVYDTLINGCSDIANTIRELTGKTEKISPLNFDEEIRKIVTARSLLNKSITEYNLQNETSIPAYAFHKCVNLENIECSNINTIGEYAFYNCSNLKDISLPNAVTDIGAYAFYGSGLTTVILPPNLTKLNSNVFNYCTKLKNIVFNDKIKSIEGSTFKACWSLEQDIILPESCKTIGQEAFRASPIKSLSGHLTSIAGGAFRECTELKTLILKGDMVCTLSATSAFIDTPIASGEGCIVIDTGDDAASEILAKEYKNATNWSAYANQIYSKAAYDNLTTTNPDLPDIW